MVNDKAVNYLGADPEVTARTLEALAQDLRQLAGGWAPDTALLRDAPLLRNWTYTQRSTMTLIGSVYGHPSLLDGRRALTSGLFAIDGNRRWARTFSRFYALGPISRYGLTD
jgi:hypothetical protein